MASASSGVQTSRGRIDAGTIMVAAAGESPPLLAPLGVDLPIEPVTLQAFVSEPLKPFLNPVVMSGAVHGYISQTAKGELVIGGGTDAYPSHSRRGSWPPIEDTVSAMLELFPFLSRVRLMRHWGGSVDITPDRSPLIGPAGPSGLYVNCGWGTGGFKAIPGSGFVAASMLATGKVPPIAVPFGLERFVAGRMIDESCRRGSDPLSGALSC